VKKQEFDGSEERKILAAMVTSKTVLGRIANQWQEQGLFQNRWANIVGTWCVKYYKKYEKAPGSTIGSLFESWARRQQDEATIEIVEKFLGHLSTEHRQQGKTMNTDHMIDCAGKHFSQVRLNRLLEGVKGEIDLGSLDKAEKLVSSYRRVEMGAGSRIDLFSDRQAILSTFDRPDNNTLIEYPEGLGKFFDRHLERDSLIAFTGIEKSGKSWMLIDVAWRAMLQRQKVAFFSIGDMSEWQIKLRFMIRAARHPMYSPGNKWPYTIDYPLEIQGKGEETSVRSKPLIFDAPLNGRQALQACEKVMRKKVHARPDNSFFGLSCHPNNSIDIYGIQAILQTWELEGFSADVVVIDYADLLSAPPGIKEKREQVDQSWKELRKISQTGHCLVVTATQAKSTGYGKVTLGPEDFSESKTKLAHVNGMVGVNVTDAEKEKGLMRLNWIELREGDFNRKRCCRVARCLPLANPCVRSVW
jgi:hypothetical protein